MLLVNYLEPQAVDDTLSFIASHSPTGSYLLFSVAILPEPLVRLSREDRKQFFALLADKEALLKYDKVFTVNPFFVLRLLLFFFWCFVMCFVLRCDGFI